MTDGFDKLQSGSKVAVRQPQAGAGRAPHLRRRGGTHSHARARMNPSRPFILRPIATSLLMAAILLIGIIAFRQLPIAALPEVDYPTMQVLTFYPGRARTSWPRP